MDLTEELRKLADLHRSGALSEDEYVKAKAALLQPAELGTSQGLEFAGWLRSSIALPLRIIIAVVRTSLASAIFVAIGYIGFIFWGTLLGITIAIPGAIFCGRSVADLSESTIGDCTRVLRVAGVAAGLLIATFWGE